jgi:anti-sigma B factor antagonist
MEITKTTTGSDTVLTLTGRLDTITSTKLQPALSEAIQSSENIILDFAGVLYVSSAGLRVLLQGQKASQNSGKQLSFKNVSPDVMEVFEVTGFSAVLTFI